ncbi:hypothetical protein HPP92_025596 [Vanilla planifolia]|uniref:Uncharacterized protein n=1 Tax=Vanilla planifolia TaxID=51239 RepID=A0A835U929_VANPL|nr:hypothetical protein HPP92_025596 [Vanilla planifolia]
MDKLMESTFYVVPKFKKDVGSTTNVPFAVSLASLQHRSSNSEKNLCVGEELLLTKLSDSEDKLNHNIGNASVCFTSGSEKMMLMKIAGGMNSKVRSDEFDYTLYFYGTGGNSSGLQMSNKTFLLFERDRNNRDFVTSERKM